MRKAFFCVPGLTRGCAGKGGMPSCKIFTAASTADVSILVGSRNPFGSTCSVILTHCQVSPDVDIVFGILGPTRMDYDRNVARSERFREFMYS